MRPDLVGQGRGSAFVTACAAYAIAQTEYEGEYVRLGVATFNQRAMRAYQKAGFEVFEQEMGTINGQVFECVHMRRKIADLLPKVATHSHR